MFCWERCVLPTKPGGFFRDRDISTAVLQQVAVEKGESFFDKEK
jgi:hypothetical protein